MGPGASGGRCTFLVGHESAEVTFLKPQGEPGDHSMARRAGPCPPMSWRRLKGGMWTGGEQIHRSLVGTLRVSLWQELMSVRGTEKLTAFGEINQGPRGSGDTTLADTSLPKTEACKGSAWSTGFAL